MVRRKMVRRCIIIMEGTQNIAGIGIITFFLIRCTSLFWAQVRGDRGGGAHMPELIWRSLPRQHLRRAILSVLMTGLSVGMRRTIPMATRLSPSAGVEERKHPDRAYNSAVGWMP